MLMSYPRWAALAVTTLGAALACSPLAWAQPAPADSPTPTSSAQQPLPQLPDLPRNNNPNNVDLADKNCWVVNGVPTMWSPALTTGPGQSAMPCYFVYGLQPH